MVAPDEARMSVTVNATAESNSAAASHLQVVLRELIADLVRLGGQVLTARTTRAPLTWSTQSMQPQEECAHDTISGEQRYTGRHRASVAVLLAVRDFSLLADVAATLTRRDARRG